MRGPPPRSLPVLLVVSSSLSSWKHGNPLRRWWNTGAHGEQFRPRNDVGCKIRIGGGPRHPQLDGDVVFIPRELAERP